MLAKYKDKIMDWLSNLSPPTKISCISLVIIYGAVGLVLLIILLYLGGWCYNWYKTGAPNLKDLEILLTILISPQNVAYVTFASVWTVDADGDGLPDAAESRVSDEGVIK